MQTPTKKVNLIGRKPASECSGDFCRLCKCAFKVKFGDIDDIKGRTIVLVCGEIITTQTVATHNSQTLASQEDIYYIVERWILSKCKT